MVFSCIKNTRAFSLGLVMIIGCFSLGLLMNIDFKFPGEFLMAGNKCQPTFIMQGLITA